MWFCYLLINCDAFKLRGLTVLEMKFSGIILTAYKLVFTYKTTQLRLNIYVTRVQIFLRDCMNCREK